MGPPIEHQQIALADMSSDEKKGRSRTTSSTSRPSATFARVPPTTTTTSSDLPSPRNSMAADEKDRLTQDLESGPGSSSSSSPSKPPAIDKSRASLAFWSVANILSTVAIVFINKHIFSSPHFNGAQFVFGAYHFLLASLILGALSSPSLSAVKQFDRRPVAVRTILPLATSMSLNVVFLNTSLAFCSVLFYQIVRVLLTPVVAAIEYLFYSKGIPRQAAYMLIPTCVGVAWLASSDTKAKPAPGAASEQVTTIFGASFALVGVLISSVYTVWIRTYQAKLDMSGTQLLYAQSPIGAVMLAVVGVVSGKIPDFAAFDSTMWLAVLASGLCSIVLNISQFNFVGGAGSVAGTIIGHIKGIIIVILGWAISGKSVSDGSIGGILLAIAGISGYTWASARYK